MNFFDKLIEAINWFKIVLSPLLVGLILGGLFYLYQPNTTGILIGSLIAATGLTVGIILATRISKKMGATEFNTKIYATPELDNLEPTKKKN